MDNKQQNKRPPSMMADWDILVEIRNTCLVGVRDGIGFKSGQAVV